MARLCTNLKKMELICESRETLFPKIVVRERVGTAGNLVENFQKIELGPFHSEWETISKHRDKIFEKSLLDQQTTIDAEFRRGH